MTTSAIESAHVETSNFDISLAKLLSRLAGMQGRAVPIHRFGMTSVTALGAEVQSLSSTQRILELWLSIVPDGDASTSNEPITKEQLPALWVGPDDLTVKLLRGVTSSGHYSCEEADGSITELSAAVARTGTFAMLRTAPQLSEAEGKAPVSARDWFFYAISKRRGVFLEAMLATFLISTLALVSGFYSMQVYDRVIPTQGYSTLVVLTIGAFLAICLEMLISYVRTAMLERASKAIDLELSGVFFNRMLQIRMDARPKAVGTFAGQIRQFEMVRNFMTSGTLFLMADAPFALFFIWIIFIIGGPIALVPLAMLPLSLIAGLYARWRVSHLSEEQLQDANRKNGLLIEAIDGIEAIKAAGGEWKLFNKWQRFTAESGERELRIRTASMLSSNLSQTIQRLGYVCLIAVGAYAINQGLVTQGALIACSIISNRALAPINQIASLFVQWQHARSALKELDAMMALPRDQENDTRVIIPESCQGEIRLEGASFSYEEAGTALQPTNLVIKPGQRIGLIGPVGSGKSTLIKLLSGLYKPTEGRVFLDGVDMRHLAPEFLREQIGYLTQDVRLFNGTLRENLTLGLPSPTDAQILSAAARTGLDRLIRAHPRGLELPIFEGGRGLSGGQRQLVGLTRMLLAKPKILLLDEPTASMDGDLEAFVMRNLFIDTPQDAIIVLCTHKRSLLGLVDHIMVVDKARLVMSEPRDAALAKLMAARPNPNKTEHPTPSAGGETA
ncbi:MAG: ATP-binding cassette domain-containing protein [Aquabacterium sp.]|uniref:ATP-binding cassette domain-containing protein n=1 Tax=Aquabacterium sp. TaxID=1872578 RepID=UPI003BDCAEF8